MQVFHEKPLRQHFRDQQIAALVIIGLIAAKRSNRGGPTVVQRNRSSYLARILIRRQRNNMLNFCIGRLGRLMALLELLYAQGPDRFPLISSLFSSLHVIAPIECV